MYIHPHPHPHPHPHQDLTTGASHFDLPSFIPLLQECLTVTNPFKRQFLLSWVAVLDSVPDIDLLHYVPHILPGLLEMLNDSHREIRQAANKVQQVSFIGVLFGVCLLCVCVRVCGLLGVCWLCTHTYTHAACICNSHPHSTSHTPNPSPHLPHPYPHTSHPQELLLEVQSTGRLDWPATSTILVHRVRTILSIQADQRSLTGGEVLSPTSTGGTALPEGGDLLTILNSTLTVLLRWLKEVVALAQVQLISNWPDILSAVLPAVSHVNDDVAQVCVWEETGFGSDVLCVCVCMCVCM